MSVQLSDITPEAGAFLAFFESRSPEDQQRMLVVVSRLVAGDPAATDAITAFNSGDITVDQFNSRIDSMGGMA